MDFVVSAANLHAFNYGLKGETDIDLFRKALDKLHVPPFVPKAGVKIQVQENESLADSTGKKYLIVIFTFFLPKILRS